MKLLPLGESMLSLKDFCRMQLLESRAHRIAEGVAPGFWITSVEESPRVLRFGFDAAPFAFRLSACVLLGGLLRRAGYRVHVSCRGKSISAMVRP